MSTPQPTPKGVAAEKTSAVVRNCVWLTAASRRVDPSVMPARPLCAKMARKTPSWVESCVLVCVFVGLFVGETRAARGRDAKGWVDRSLCPG